LDWTLDDLGMFTVLVKQYDKGKDGLYRKSIYYELRWHFSASINNQCHETTAFVADGYFPCLY
jgi:hypothetical protein